MRAGEHDDRGTDRVTIQGFELFLALRPFEIDEIIRHARNVKFSAGEFIVRVGEAADRVYVLVEGRAKASIVSQSGAEMIIWLSRGQVLGLGGLVPGEVVHPGSLQAIDECHTLEWTKTDILALATRFPKLFENALGLVYKWLCILVNSYQATNSLPVAQRLAYTLSNLAHQFADPTSWNRNDSSTSVTISNQELASMLGCNSTVFTVSRILRQWEREGLIAKKGRHVRILALKRLQALAAEFLKNNSEHVICVCAVLPQLLALSSTCF